MKQIFLIITIVLFALQLKAQLIYDRWGNIISYPPTDGFKENLEVSEVSTFIIPNMDNDSLCNIYNNGKSIEELENIAIGFDLRSEPISLKEKGTCTKLKHGKLWRYAIKGATAQGIGVDLGFPKLPKGSYVEIFPTDTTVNLDQQREIFHSENLSEGQKKRGLSTWGYGKSLMIEYFEPDTLKDKDDIVIRRITYGFVGFDGTTGSSYNNQGLKSGYYGSSQYPQCQKDIICSDIGNYQNEAKSVVLIRLFYNIDTNNDGYTEFYISKGTGFFLNKVGGYASSDLPIMVTAGHGYYIEISGSAVDLDSYISKIEVRTNYQNAECGTDDTNNRGRLLPGSFNRIALGSSWDEDPGLSSYSPSNDYAILQPSSDISTLADYDLEYSAWSNSHNYYTSEGYFCIHHPKGDVKKINKDNDRAVEVFSDGFILKYDVGIAELGSSGAPVFNSSRQVVGFHVTSDDNKDCSLVGQMNSTSGRFDDLYYLIASYLDPNSVGSATSSNPVPPTPPAHCDDCIQNYGETAIDCGGPDCYPCGMQDVVTLKTPMDISGYTAKSRYELFAEPDPNTLLALKSGSFTFEAGLNVHLNGGFEVEKGAEFYAGIDAELMSEPDRYCEQDACLFLETIFSPNGDGNDDYLTILQAYVTKYDIKIFDGRWNGPLIYSKSDVPIYNNGYIEIWDGAEANHVENFIAITYYDCWGNSHDLTFAISALGLKSATFSEENLTSDVTNVENGKVKIVVYPNPFSDDVTISFSGNMFPLEYKLMDLNGKVVMHNNTSSNSETINLSGLASGTYIINAKAGEYNLVQKLIKE